MVTVSALVLTRNSSKTIKQCLSALENAVDEILIVDTGSTDNTIPIVQEFDAKIVHFQWCDDFAAARNFGLQHVTSDWVIAVDSDEILYKSDLDLIRMVANDLHNHQDEIVVQIVQANRINGDIGDQLESRMFQTNRGFHWEHPIHEQIRTATNTTPHFFSSKIRFLHDGYDPNVVSSYDKSLRNVKILRRDVEEHPNDWTRHFFLGRDSLGIAEVEESIKHLQIACELGEKSVEPAYLANCYRMLVIAYESGGRYEEAEKQALYMMKKCPDYPDGFYMYARLLMRHVNAEIEKMKNAILKTKELALKYPLRGFVESDSSLAKWKTDMAISDVYRYLGNYREMRKAYLKTLSYGIELPFVQNALNSLDTKILSLAREIQESREKNDI